MAFYKYLKIAIKGQVKIRNVPNTNIQALAKAKWVGYITKQGGYSVAKQKKQDTHKL